MLARALPREWLSLQRTLPVWTNRYGIKTHTESTGTCIDWWMLQREQQTIIENMFGEKDLWLCLLVNFVRLLSFSHCLSMVVLRPSSSISIDCVVREDWAIFCHADSGRVGRVWSAWKNPLKCSAMAENWTRATRNGDQRRGRTSQRNLPEGSGQILKHAVYIVQLWEACGVKVR